MSTIEPKIKSQYAKFFHSSDSRVFKQLAEHYLSVAATLKTKHVQGDKDFRLWLRNVQKRLFIGVGCELLLKSHYLHQGYGVNVPQKGSWHLYRIRDVQEADYDCGNTYSMNFLLDQLKNGPRFTQQDVIEHGFRIAKVFRNKEGHVAVYWHSYDARNYSDVEAAIVPFYQEAFGQQVVVQFSMEKNERGIFRVA